MNYKPNSNIICIIILTILVLGIISIQDCNDNSTNTNGHKKEAVVTNTDKKEDKTNEKKDSKENKDTKKKTDSKSSDSKDKKTTKSTEKKTKKSVNYKTLTARVTAYCGCTSCSGKWGTQTSTGATCTQGRTIAVDPSVIPLGSKVEINGHTYTAEDTGGGVKGNHIDIYFASHSATQAWGSKTLTVKVYNK